MNISEETFALWSLGPGKTESEKCENAETAVRKAIKADKELSSLNITVSTQGSYQARTNIRLDSDVDICVQYREAYFSDYEKGISREMIGHSDAPLEYSTFKNMVEKALRSYFGEAEVTRGKKAFDIHSNTYRIDADVIPAFDYRWYTGQKNSNQTWAYHEGIAFIPDSGGRIVNWPKQTYTNGIARNANSGRRYKRTIRILKRLRNQMQENKVEGAMDVASFLIESLVWNAPLEAFAYPRYTEVVRHVIADLWNRTRKDEECSEWGEVGFSAQCDHHIPR